MPLPQAEFMAPRDPGVLVRPGEAFGPLPLLDGVVAVTIRTAVGELTGLHAEPTAAARGTVLLVPGFTGSKEDFGPLLPLLAAHGWDTWAYSQRGQADSAAPEGLDAYRLEDFAADACEVADIIGVGAPVHLLGHSFGGLVARAAALRAPEAFLDVVLLCSGPRGFGSSKDDLRSIVDASGSLGLWANGNPALAQVPTAELEPADAFLKVRAAATSPDNLRGIMDVLWDTVDRTADLRDTGLPVLVAHGATDDAWPQAWQKEMADVLAGPYRIIPDAGHCPAEENPTATADLLHAYWDLQLEA
ncbi:Lysophospholipase, alpha-beta hydrolase superfamily [Sanguibacter gelidistatuariae]|uniref:Lysophospholipase, alpha-beta hydrolase superfamily n=1 Tax=Sanguibacter gelidistatuariae TaxID=1814289 RepID=A0A1G6WW49_9MICO|nr:alpha/beta fold hydrolase [Sanguibacter gelidistatuariae]SDD69853.1 Lysophospholipase, alpha-beta hydrolase superfamily [Sanguibacter gelidistatuariae]